MFRRILRLAVLLCLLMGTLALLPVAATAALGFTGDTAHPVAQNGTMPSPTPTDALGTVPTAEPTKQPPEPTKPPPRPTAKPTTPPPHPPTATPVPVIRRPAAASTKGIATIGRYKITKIIGQRLSPETYAYTDGGRLYWSPADGRGWRYVTTNPLVDHFVMSAADPNVLYSGTGVDCTTEDRAPAPFYRSDFRGKTWEELPTAFDLVPYLVDPNDPYRVWAADCELPFFSEDGGENWVARLDGVEFPYWFDYRLKDMADAPLTNPEVGPIWSTIYAGGALDSGNSIVAATENVGETWRALSPLAGPGPIGLRVLEADPYVAGRLWAADAQGVWFTSDSGETWTLISEGLEDVISARGRVGFGQITDLAYAPATGQLYVATTRGLYMWAPGATMFQVFQREHFGLEAIESLLITESNPNTLWVNAATGAYRFRIR